MRLFVALAFLPFWVVVEGTCQNFSSLYDAQQSTFRCDSSCLQPTDRAEDVVFGTEDYGGSSPVCLAALHAGVVGLQGGQVHFTRGNVTNIIGTAKNRIVSKSAESDVTFRFVREDNQPAKEQDLAGDMVVVHNSYYDGNLHLSCISDESGTKLARWDYRPLPDKAYPFGPRGLHIQNQRTTNRRAIRCLGSSPANDVLAIVQTSDQIYKAESSTIRASRGDHHQIDLQKASGQGNDVFLRRLPDSFKYTSGDIANVPLPLTLSSVTPGDSGIYIVGSLGHKKWSDIMKVVVEEKGAYFHVMVRECKAGRFGWKCKSWCPDCQNGGVCHSRTGTCVCPPGFAGPTCRRPCPRGNFGSSCQLQCIKDTLGFVPPQEGSCEHLTFCLPDPFGCSCAPGFFGPTCSDECSHGRYGAGCSLSCEEFCVGGECDPSTGRCVTGCVPHVPCDSENLPLDLPRLRNPPTVTDILHTSAEVRFAPWTPEADDGSGDFLVTNYEVQYRREDERDWTSVGPSEAESEHAVTLQPLSSGYTYSVRVLVHTAQGTLDGSTNQRVTTVDFITNCADDVKTISASQVTAASVLLSWPPPPVPIHNRCNASVTIRLIAASSRVTSVWGSTRGDTLSLEGLTPNTTYTVCVEMKSSTSQTPRSKIFRNLFRTLVVPPSEPKVKLDATEVGQIVASWTLPPGSTAAHTYYLTYELLKHEACPDWDTEEAVVIHTLAAQALLLEDLESYATYRICVTAKNEVGESPDGCETVTTVPSAPDVRIGPIDCPQSDPIQCIANISGDCVLFNGPNIYSNLRVRTFLDCENRYLESNYVGVINSSRFDSISFVDDDEDELIPGQLYDVFLSVNNDAGNGRVTHGTFNNPPARPPAVRDLEAVLLSPREVRLLWNDPCPPNGQITHLSYKMISDLSYRDIKAFSCSEQSYFDRCVNITDLTPNTNYTFRVAVKANLIRGEFRDINVVTKETEPGPPFKLSYDPGESALNISLHLPDKPSGVLGNCSVEIKSTNVSCVLPVLNLAQGPLVCKLQGLAQGHRYTAKGYCCNSVGCGQALETVMATLPLPPTFNGTLTMLKKTDTSIIILLPSVQNAGDGDSSLTVMVQRLPKEGEGTKVNFTEEYLKTSSRSFRRRRQSDESCINSEDIYVAGVSRGEERLFVVGNGDSGGDYDNCPLMTGDYYRIAVVAEVDLEGRKSYAETSLRYPVMAAWDGTPVFAIGLSLLAVAVLFTVIVVISLVERRSSARPKGGHMTPRTNSQNVRLLSLQREDFPLSEPGSASAEASAIVTFSGDRKDGGGHYENLPSTVNSNNLQAVGDYATAESHYEEIKKTVCKPISRQQLESHLNYIITSAEVLREWKTIPLSMEKSKNDGEKLRAKGLIPAHESLPYDESRVKLYSSNKSPLKDFINASYIHSFSDCKRYIVAVSPKDDQRGSPANFWQMICEQRIDAIIMLHDSYGKGQGSMQYFRPGAVLHYDGFFVDASRHKPNHDFHLSTIKVQKGVTYHNTKHYHFWRWPKHGVIRDPHPLALMLKEVIANHPVGGVLVHCPQGPEQTGSVLMALLLYEMLAAQGSIDPAKVLRHIRAYRAGLVENREQLRFSLAVFDELVHGFETAVPADELDRAETTGSQVLYQRAMTLLSGLTFYSASLESVIALNRSSAILPSDNQIRMLNPQVLSSRYLNAVLVSGLKESTSVVATEHPNQGTMPRFWRFLVESKCHMLVLIHTYEAADMDDFPSLLPLDNYNSLVGDFSIQLSETVLGESLNKFILEVSSTKVNHKMTVYQIRNWRHGNPCPPSPEALVCVADLVLCDTRMLGPTVLCCADGALGCGLVAGAVLLAERLFLTKEVDVYRTVVKLKRCRPQFINSQCQFDFLYETARALVEVHKSYLNLFA